jgi:hypothetical protein
MVNNNHRSLILFLLLVTVVTLSACSQGKLPPPEAREEPAAPREARPIDVGGGTGGNATGSVPAGPGAATASGPIAWTAPADWVQETPRSNMRYAQYRVPGPGGDGECVVFYFGPGQGGDVQANIARWANQFEQPDGVPSTDRVQVRELEGGSMPMWIAEVTGTYNGGMTMTDQPSPSQPDSMLLGGIVQAAEAPWFFKFTGPEETVRANEEAFVGLMESIRAGG